jgi:hypothetical protein
MRWGFEGRQRDARVGGKGHAKGNGCDGYYMSSAIIWRGEIDINNQVPCPPSFHLATHSKAAVAFPFSPHPIVYSIVHLTQYGGLPSPKYRSTYRAS